MNIAITGSNGYVGNFLVEYFSKKGNNVIGLDIASMDRQKTYKNFKFVKCDVRNKALVKKTFEKEKITHIFHLAYLMSPQHNRKFEFDVDVNGSKNVFEAANEVKTVKQFIHFSSASIYGGWPYNPLWIVEKSPRNPRDWVYAQNKKIVEDYYFNFKKRKDLKLVNFRMCTAVGPSYYKGGGVVKTLSGPIGLLLNGKDTLLQFIHEDDVNKIVELTVKKKIEGVFNLAPDSYSITKELNPNPKKIFIPFPKILFKLIVSILWYTRIAPISPTSVNLVAHGVVVSPKKLMKALDYRFKYSTKEAFFDAVKKRKKNKTL